MYHIIIMELPLWGAALLILGGVPIAAVLLQILMRKVVPPPRAKAHNDVAGFLVAVIGVVYAVTMGFSIDDQWDKYTDVRDSTGEEAFTVTAVGRGGAVLGADDRRAVTRAVVAYNRAVVAWWPTAMEKAEQPRSEGRALAHLFETVGGLRPATEPQQAYLEEATDQLLRVSVLNSQRHSMAERAHLRASLWIAVFLTSAVTLFFSLLFGLESPWLHYTMIAGVGLVIATNLFVITMIEYPLAGALSVSPADFTESTADLLPASRR